MSAEATLDLFLARFTHAVAKSTNQFPVVTVWRESSLITLISTIKAQLQTDGTNPSSLPPNQELIERIQRIGLATRLKIKAPTSGKQPAPEFYQIEIGASLFSEPADVIEVLQAYEPAGVLCYSSALRYYQLTTQHFSFQHVADIGAEEADEHISRIPQTKLRSRRHPSDVKSAESTEEISSSRKGTLGTLRFIYANTDCYSTRRKKKTIPGVQNRVLSPRSRIRITTLEQTLLDTLTRPFYCGGPSIIFEAWQQYPEKLNQTKLAKLLEKIGNDHLTRRTGLMLEMLKYALQPTLSKVTEESLGRLDRTDQYNLLPLLPGLPYTSVNDKWMLLAP